MTLTEAYSNPQLVYDTLSTLDQNQLVNPAMPKICVLAMYGNIVGFEDILVCTSTIYINECRTYIRCPDWARNYQQDLFHIMSTMDPNSVIEDLTLGMCVEVLEKYL